MTFVSSSLFCCLSADRFFLTVPRPEEILRDFEPSNRCRRHLRPWTLFSLSDTKIPHSQNTPFSTSVCIVRHIFQTSLGFEAYMLLRCSCLDTFYCIYQAAPCQTSGSDECGPELGFATGRWGQLTYGYVALWWSRLFC